MSEDLKKGREVAFVYSDALSEEVSAARREEETNPENLSLYRSLSEETLVCTSKLSGGTVSVATLLREFSPDVVRIHNPSRIHQPIVTLCRKLGVCVVYDIMDDWDGFAEQPWGVGTSAWYVNHADVVTAVSGFIVQKKNVSPLPADCGIQDASPQGHAPLTPAIQG